MALVAGQQHDQGIEVLREQIESSVIRGLEELGARPLGPAEIRRHGAGWNGECSNACVRSAGTALGARFVLRIVARKQRVYRLRVELVDTRTLEPGRHVHQPGDARLICSPRSGHQWLHPRRGRRDGHGSPV